MKRNTQIALAFGVWLAAFAAHAQPKATDAPPRYDALIESALEEYRLGHWVEAKAYFAQAHELQPNARTLRGLGLVCYELRKYVEAIGYFQQALANPNRPLTETMRDGVNELLRDAERFVSRVDLTLSPSDATLTLDGHPVTRDPEGRIMLDAGTHELAAEAHHYESATRTLSTDGGEAIRVTLALRPTQPTVAEAAVTPQPLEPQPSAAADSSSAAIGPWIVIAASGAVMITGGVLLGLSLSDKAEIEDARKGEHMWSDVEGAYERVPVFSTTGAILLGVGAVGIGAGIAWKLWPSEDPSEHAVALQPLPGGAAIRGSF